MIPALFFQVLIIQACQLLATGRTLPAVQQYQADETEPGSTSGSEDPKFTLLGSTQQEEHESDPALPSQTTDPHLNKHVVLTRPHTVLVLSTVTGGEAIRGAFTGAIADQIRKSDGNTSISDLFDRAVGNMKKSEPMCADQWPEMRKVTDKILMLPPVLKTCP